jgi:hypothetical protein
MLIELTPIVDVYKKQAYVSSWFRMRFRRTNAVTDENLGGFEIRGLCRRYRIWNEQGNELGNEQGLRRSKRAVLTARQYLISSITSDQ